MFRTTALDLIRAQRVSTSQGRPLASRPALRSILDRAALRLLSSPVQATPVAPAKQTGKPGTADHQTMLLAYTDALIDAHNHHPHAEQIADHIWQMMHAEGEGKPEEDEQGRVHLSSFPEFTAMLAGAGGGWVKLNPGTKSPISGRVITSQNAWYNQLANKIIYADESKIGTEAKPLALPEEPGTAGNPLDLPEDREPQLTPEQMRQRQATNYAGDRPHPADLANKVLLHIRQPDAPAPTEAEYRQLLHQVSGMSQGRLVQFRNLILQNHGDDVAAGRKEAMANALRTAIEQHLTGGKKLHELIPQPRPTKINPLPRNDREGTASNPSELPVAEQTEAPAAEGMAQPEAQAANPQEQPVPPPVAPAQPDQPNPPVDAQPAAKEAPQPSAAPPTSVEAKQDLPVAESQIDLMQGENAASHSIAGKIAGDKQANDVVRELNRHAPDSAKLDAAAEKLRQDTIAANKLKGGEGIAAKRKVSEDRKKLHEEKAKAVQNERKTVVSAIGAKSADVQVDAQHFPNMTPEMQSSLEDAEKFLSGILGKDQTIAVKPAGGSGGNMGMHGDEVYINPNVGSKAGSILVHEMGHNIQENNPEVNKAVQDFWRYRTEGHEKIDISTIPGNEGIGGFQGHGRHGNFERAFPKAAAHYAGHEGGLETFTMGLQKLYDDPAAFAAKDPEYAQFIIGQVQKINGGKAKPTAKEVPAAQPQAASSGHHQPTFDAYELAGKDPKNPAIQKAIDNLPNLSKSELAGTYAKMGLVGGDKLSQPKLVEKVSEAIRDRAGAQTRSTMTSEHQRPQAASNPVTAQPQSVEGLYKTHASKMTPEAADEIIRRVNSLAADRRSSAEEFRDIAATILGVRLKGSKKVLAAKIKAHVDRLAVSHHQTGSF